MDNTLNRPLFRRREARDRLNDMAGIKGYQDGGPIRSGMEMEARRVIPSPILRNEPSRPPSGIESALMATDPYLMETFAPAQTTQRPKSARELAAEQTGGTVRSALSSIADMGAGALSAAGSGLYGMAADVLSPAFATLGATSMAAQLERQSDIAYNVARSNLANGLSATEGMTPEDFDMEPSQFDFIVAKAKADAREEAKVRKSLPPPTGPSGMEMEARGSVPPSSAMGRSGMEMEARGSVPPSSAMGRSGMEAEARGSRPPAPGTTPAAPGTAAKGPSFEGTGRGAGPRITNPAEVAAGLNAPDPSVREKTAADFMQEYMANAPKYEGGDKRLMHAMIGFAIAAGESPNAMTNIANGLLAGSEMMLKDKAAKDEFDRQVQLSAMEYGLQEATKQRDRAKQALSFVALEDTTYNGRPVKRGEQVYIPYGEIEKNGGVVPPGFGDTALVTAISEREKGLMEALETARKENLVDDTFVEGQRETFSKAAGNAIAAQRGIDYIEAAILKVGEEGNITGLEGALDTIVGNVAAAAGLKDVNAQFSDRQQVEGLVKKAFQNLIPAALSGVQTANSISNRDIEILAQAYVDSMLEGGVFSMATITEDKLLNSMKSALDLLQGSRQQALTDMSAVERTISGRTLRSGESALSVIEPYRALIPGQDEVGVPSRLGSLYLSEDGVYEIMRPGG